MSIQTERGAGRAQERGAALAEYALLLTLVAAACVVAVTALGQILIAIFTQVAAFF